MNSLPANFEMRVLWVIYFKGCIRLVVRQYKLDISLTKQSYS